MSQKTRLWRGIQTFEERLETWEGTPFETLDFEGMEAEIARYVTGDDRFFDSPRFERQSLPNVANKP